MQQVAHLEVQVRTGGVAGAAAQADDLPALNPLALRHQQRGEVEIEGAAAIMQDADAVTAGVVPTRVDDSSVVRGHRRRVGRDGKVESAMSVVVHIGGPVVADHDVIHLPGRIVMVDPRQRRHQVGQRPVQLAAQHDRQ